MKIIVDENKYDVILAVIIAVAMVAIVFFSALSYADNPHHEIPEPVTIVIEVTNYTQVVDMNEIIDLKKAVSAMSALSSIPSLNRSMGGTTGVGVGFGGYDGQGAAIVLEHYVGNMSYRAGVGHSGGEEIVNFGVMGSW